MGWPPLTPFNIHLPPFFPAFQLNPLSSLPFTIQVAWGGQITVSQRAGTQDSGKTPGESGRIAAIKSFDEFQSVDIGGMANENAAKGAGNCADFPDWLREQNRYIARPGTRKTGFVGPVSKKRKTTHDRRSSLLTFNGLGGKCWEGARPRLALRAAFS